MPIRSAAAGDAAALPLYELLESQILAAYRQVVTGPDAEQLAAREVRSRAYA